MIKPKKKMSRAASARANVTRNANVLHGRRTRQDFIVRSASRRRRITVAGARNCQTLQALIAAGAKGVTAQEVSSWALRLAGYVSVLRHTYRLNIDMERVPRDNHDGWHGRYFLRTPVKQVP